VTAVTAAIPWGCETGFVETKSKRVFASVVVWSLAMSAFIRNIMRLFARRDDDFGLRLLADLGVD
jgi:hypothetical protein